MKFVCKRWVDAHNDMLNALRWSINKVNGYGLVMIQSDLLGRLVVAMKMSCGNNRL